MNVFAISRKSFSTVEIWFGHSRLPFAQIFRDRNQIKECVHFIILAISAAIVLQRNISEIMMIMYFMRILEVSFITACWAIKSCPKLRCRSDATLAVARCRHYEITYRGFEQMRELVGKLGDCGDAWCNEIRFVGSSVDTREKWHSRYLISRRLYSGSSSVQWNRSVQ